MTDDFHHLQQRIEDALLDVYEGNVPAETAQELTQAWQAVGASLESGPARSLAVTDFTYDSRRRSPPSSASAAASSNTLPPSRCSIISAPGTPTRRRLGG